MVCLQETRWTASTATNFLQTYPGFTVAHLPANETDRRGLSGGVAIIIPCTFRLLQEKEVLPGKAIAAQVQTRTDQFWILSIYCHPQTVRADCEAIAHWLHINCTGDDPCFLLGDFNQGDMLFPDIWRRITEYAQGEDIMVDQPTFWGPNGTSSLDRVILPIEYMDRGLIQHPASGLL